ncbi:MAG TPA: hypothetical protein VGQ71_03665, partial [Terriglobales bacterium]|nr:hypothetical protein [Terriglobales bacterium]
KRVSELETQQCSSPAQAISGNVLAVSAHTQVEAARPAPTDPPAEHSAVRQAEHEYPSLNLRGFADVDFSATDEPGVRSGFNLGQFVLHLASPLSKKISYFGELSFTASSTGYAVEVERSIIRYDYNDHFKLSFGRYHTPIGYWNTAFHHGAWLQTTISRPEMVRFGGRFVPIHFVGLLAEGSIPSGGLGLGYNAGVGNGRASIISRAGDAGDSNNHRAWVASVFGRPSRFYGLQFGASVYRDKISPDLGPQVSEWITSAHVAWTKEKPEVLAEFANVRHRELLTGRIVNSQGYYIQLAYRLPWSENKWKPYYRFEYIHVPQSEPVLNVANLVGSTIGVRYDISGFAAMKGEYRNTRRQAGEPRVNGLFLQTSFTF